MLKSTLLLFVLFGSVLYCPERDCEKTQARFPSDIFDCVVTESKNAVVTIVCDTPNLFRQDQPICDRNPKDPNCEHVTFDIPEANMNEFAEWQIAPENSYAIPPRFQAAPKKGQLLKARWDENGLFKAVASCEARTYRAVADYCRDRDYCRHPFSLLSQPGCQPPTPFVRALLSRASK